MVKHIIIWTLKNNYSDKEKNEIKANIKSNLEGLLGKIDGLLAISVQIDRLASSNADLMLDSTFESKEALAAYATHPEHVAIANRDVKPFTEIRSCIDFEI